MAAPLPKFQSLLRNPLSIVGLAIASVSTAFGFPMMVIDMFSRHTQPYLAVVIYLVLPFVAGGGMVLALAGMQLERRRRRLRPDQPRHRLPMLDLNRPAHQVLVLIGLTVVMVIVVLLSVTGYRAYHFTESVEFCGLVCHQVMKPEYTAYQSSPHARVACAHCHVGPGADWFVRSKLSGLRQVYSVAFNKYPRPIETPVKNMRPAQQTCEQCHWPQKSFGARQRVFEHTLADKKNTPWQVRMLVRIGGGDSETGSAEGIHWHMNIGKEIEYVAVDESREVIPWVKVTERDGRVTEYVSEEAPPGKEWVGKSEVRRMDCLDCHNRPSHIFQPASSAVDKAFAAGRLDRELPFLKREAVRLLVQAYSSEVEARAAIADGLRMFYREQYPEISAERGAAIEAAAAELVAVYGRNFFPEMKADWRGYPNHVGHFTSDGCFRCHDGLHKSVDGKVITKDCNTCHAILAQGPPEGLQAAGSASQGFRHPVDVGTDVSGYKCSQCHTGGEM